MNKNELQKKLEDLSEWERKELSKLQSRGWPVEVILFMFELFERKEELKGMKWKYEKGYWHIDWDKRKKANSIGKMLTSLSRPLQLKKANRFHDLRHTFATRLVKQGIDLYTVAKLLGHKTISVTTKYAHHSVDSLRKAIEKIF